MEWMTVHELAIAKIQQLPELLAQEVLDFIEFLLLRNDSNRWQLWTYFLEAERLAEAGMTDYLPNLGQYENRLKDGEVRW